METIPTYLQSFVVIAFVDQILWRPTWPDLGHCFHWAAISGDYC